MNIHELFQIEETIAAFKQEQAYRERSTIHMFSHRHPGPVRPQKFALVEMDYFYSLLPTCSDVDEIMCGFGREEMYLLDDMVMRNNRELVEFHHIDNSCPRCRQTLTKCACRELTKIETSELIQQIQTVNRKLFMQKRLVIVTEFADGTCSIMGAGNENAPNYFPFFGMGTGFDIYIEDYHLDPPK